MNTKVLSVLAILSLFTSPALSAECNGKDTEKAFFTYVLDNKWKPYTFDEKGMSKFMSWINEVRKKDGMVPFPEGTKFYFAQVDIRNTGLVYIHNGCVLDSFTLPSNIVAQAFGEVNLEPDSIIRYIIPAGDDA